MDIKKYLSEEFHIDNRVIDFCLNVEPGLNEEFKKIDKISEINQFKVLSAMQKNKLSDIHFTNTSGYGYNDSGRDILEDIYAHVFKGESALVRPQIISGTHALTLALFGNLKYGDELISVVGKPYDTLEKVIGIKKSKGSLIENGIIYKQVDLDKNGNVDFEGILKTVSIKTKMVTIQRSKGYAWRHSFSVSEIGEIIKFVKNINSEIICMIDNCYGEFVDEYEPMEVCADLIVGSLIKNPGGGLAPVGGYIVGKEEYVENAAIRLTSPGLGKEVGPSLGLTKSMIQGLFLAPSVVASSLKTSVFASKIFEDLGFSVLPKYNEKRSDIVQAIKMKNSENIVSFCRGIQLSAAVDSFVVPEPSYMPGYDCPIIMAAGAFVQGSSIELSADAPIKYPFAVYFQGGLTWHHGKIGIITAVNNMVKDGLINIF